jgi:hypothetical protein
MLTECELICELYVDNVNLLIFIATNLVKNSQSQNMIRKTKQEFQFIYPLKHKVVRDLKIVTEHIGDLVVEGVGYFNPSASPIDVFDRYSVDIDFVKWNGTDIKAVLDVMGNMEEIEEASIRYFAQVLENKLRHAA